MFNDVNTKVGTIATDVGQTPQQWNAGVFDIIKNLSETVVLPIAGLIITFVLCYELISLIVDKNNMHDIDTFMFFKYFFKAGVAVLMTTSSTAIFVPFTTQELFQTGKEALYYGLNALSNNMIMVDRKKLKNPNGLILGTPGSGKSFSAKREIANAFLVTNDDIIICDPEAEYFPLVYKLGGQIIKIAPTSKNYVNPMDIIPYHFEHCLKFR